MLNYEAKDFIVPSPLLRFYLQHGAEVVTIHWGLAFDPAPALADFINSQTEARIAADIAEKPQKSKLAKDTTNSFYGRNRVIKLILYSPYLFFVYHMI